MIKKLLVILAVINTTFVLEARASSLNVTSGDSSISFDGTDFIYDSSSYSSPLTINNTTGETATISTDGDMAFTSTNQRLILDTSDIGIINNDQITISASSYSSFINNSSSATNSTFTNNGIIGLISSGSFASNSGVVVNNGIFSLITNNGNLGGAIVNNSAATINNFINSRSAIISSAASTINNRSSDSIIGTITNSGTMMSSGGSSQAVILNNGTISTITNSNLMSSSGSSGAVVLNSSGGIITTIENDSDAVMTSFATNSSTIHNNGGEIAIISNSGTISSSGNSDLSATVGAIVNDSGTITTIENNSGGVISASGDYGSAIYNNYTIDSITNNSGASITSSQYYGINNQFNIGTISNYGTITSDLANINNAGTITTLNNSQGGDVDALTFTGTLPENYNILINSSSSYGQISADSISGSTNFGILSQSSITQRLYSGVLQGLTSGNVENTSGSFNNMTWNLSLQDGSSTIWDLSFSGAPQAETQASITNLTAKLKGNFMSQAIATNFANMNTYDCNLFDAKGMCVSIGGQNSKVNNPSVDKTSAVLVVGHKISSHFRIGGFVNQNLNRNSVENGAKISNKTPLMGLFAVWNNQSNGLGYQVKLANAYQDQDVTTTREIIGLSEAGVGETNLTTQSYVGELSYALMLEKTMLRPYLALRYTSMKQDAYTENSSVTTPLSYSAVNSEFLTSLIGTKFIHPLTLRTSLTGSIGLEQDLHSNSGTFTASGISGLTSEELSDNNIRDTRAVTSIGAYFSPTKAQRISGEIFYQQLPFQRTNTTTIYVNYMMGF